MERYKNGVLESTTSKSLNSISTNESPYVVDAAYSVNFPVFRDFALVENYLNTGDGYKDAINYAEKPPIDIGGSYTGTLTVETLPYPAMSLTVLRTRWKN